MTNIVITKKDNDITCVECSDHTGFADFGKDIVCAGVSSITQTAVLGVQTLTNFEKAQTILKTMLLGLEDLEKQYPKYIKLEDKRI